MRVRFVLLPAEMAQRALPCSEAASSWDARWPTARPRMQELIAAGAALTDPPGDFLTGGSNDEAAASLVGADGPR